MILLVGLGNPGDEYKMNRHNVGFMFADWLQRLERSNVATSQHSNSEWKYDKYLQSEIVKTELSSNDKRLTTILAKPQTFMNRSGEAVKKLTTNYKLPTTNLFVAHDDLDITIGNFKIQKGTGPKMHNGISSIEDTLGTSDFWRVRIGVDNRDSDHRIPGETYVLQNFSSEELEIVIKTFDMVFLRLKQVLQNI